LKKNSNLVLREIYGKNILMPVKYNEASNDPIFLNETAALIWKLADNVQNITDLVSAVCSEYGLKVDSAEAVAIEGFVNQLIESKLIIVE